jgi:hypothetical protein
VPLRTVGGLLSLDIHCPRSRGADLVRSDHFLTNPAAQVTAYRGVFGNRCSAPSHRKAGSC